MQWTADNTQQTKRDAREEIDFLLVLNDHGAEKGREPTTRCRMDIRATNYSGFKRLKPSSHKEGSVECVVRRGLFLVRVLDVMVMHGNLSCQIDFVVRQCAEPVEQGPW